MKQFDLIQRFDGYVTKPDVTNTKETFLVSGSQNVLINEQDKIETRKGYTIDGATSTDGNGIVSSFEWLTSKSSERALRAYNTSALEFRFTSSGGTVSWDDIKLNDDLGTMTVTIASPAVVSNVGHGLSAGDSIYFTTSGSLPTGMSANTRYYVIATGLTADAFQFSATSGGAAINTSGSQSGAHKVYSLSNTLTADTWKFTTWWDSTIAEDLLLMVNGTSNIFKWRGGVAETSSYTSSTIVTTTTDLAASKFPTAGVVSIAGTPYNYTGVSGDTFTGVTPDPSGESTGVSVSLALDSVPNSSITQLPNTLSNDLIGVNRNQIFIGDLSYRDIYVSKTSSYTDFSYSSPRTVGEGALLTLDNTVKGFVTQEDQMYVTAGKDDWYRTSFTLTSDNTNEIMEIKKLKSGPQQAAQSQDLIAKIKNDVVFVSNEPTLDSLGRVENVDTPQSRDLSDPIKPDFDAANFTNGHIKYFQNSIYITTPNDAKLYIYDIEEGRWQPPQLMAIRRLAIIGGELYGHSALNSETYKLFADDTYNDNNGLIDFRAKLAYRNFGDRANLKNFDEYFTEGYISANTDITVGLAYDYQGSSSAQEAAISGDDDDIIFAVTTDNSLGKVSLGKEPLGSSSTAPDDLAKFRIIHTTRPSDFYELQVSFSSTSENGRFQILSTGPNVRKAPSDNVLIKR